MVSADEVVAVLRRHPDGAGVRALARELIVDPVAVYRAVDGDPRVRHAGYVQVGDGRGMPHQEALLCCT